jgi:hypothetical protein
MWKHSGSPRENEFKVTQSAGKVLTGFVECVAGVLPGTWTDSEFWQVMCLADKLERGHQENISRSSYWRFDSPPWRCSTVRNISDPEVAAKFRLENGGPFGCGIQRFSCVSSLEHLRGYRLSTMKTSNMLLFCYSRNKDTRPMRPGWKNTLWQVIKPSRKQHWITFTNSTFIAYCQFPLLKSCLLLMSNENFLSAPPS